MTFFANLITLSPLLFLASITLYLLDRRDSLRRGAGLIPDLPENVEPDTPEIDDDYDLPPEPQPPLEYDPNGPPEDSESESESDVEPEVADDPAQPHEPRQIRTRNIGPKKMRSIQRRDQRRAYHEFLRAQAEQREEAEKGLREEEEERAFENARRRALVEEEITERKKQERKERVKAEARLREKETKDTEKLKGLLEGKKYFELEKLATKIGRERGWVETVLKKEGLVGVNQGEIRMITKHGWWISVGEKEWEKLWARLEEAGRMRWDEMGSALEEILVGK